MSGGILSGLNEDMPWDRVRIELPIGESSVRVTHQTEIDILIDFGEDIVELQRGFLFYATLPLSSIFFGYGMCAS